MYVETPGLVSGGNALQGFFAHLSFAPDIGTAELLLLDDDEPLDTSGAPTGTMNSPPAPNHRG